MKTPCEEIVWYVIPCIRAELARALVERHGLTQRRVAGIMGITDAAVSQYAKGKRGGRIHDPGALEIIVEVADRIVRENGSLTGEDMCRVCRVVRDSPDYHRLVRKTLDCDLDESVPRA